MKNRMYLLGCLTLLIVIMISAGGAAAAPERIFSDVPKNHWAERYITRMNLMGIIEGYEDGSYGLNRPVSRFEIITMIIRVMGLEEQATGKSIPESFWYPASVPAWAQKYVAMAVIQGIISGEDLISFRGGEAAKRYEVAELIGKAMGLSEAAPQHDADALPYIDEADIPASSRGYVSILRTNGLMEGNEDGTFRPLANVTRGEMAVLMAKLDEKMGKLPDKEIKGTVSQVTQGSITVKTTNGYKTLILDEDCFVFLKDGEGELADIIPSDDTVLVVKEGFRARLIDVLSNNSSASPIQNLSGKAYGNMVAVNFYPEPEIVISNVDKEQQTIPLRDDCIIERDKEEVLLKDILPGDQVEVIIEEGKAEEILAVPAKGTITGKIKEVVIRDKALLTIVDETDENHTYEINSNTRIRKDGATVTLLELKAGDNVDITWESNFATRVYAQTRILKEQIKGKVTKVATDLNMLIISLEGDYDHSNDGQTAVFTTDSTKIVTLDGTVSTRLNRVKTDNQLVIVGDWGDGFVTAQTILILGADE
ncbi:MAG: S-layer homology domain-containing protein [Bacillota bacterium]|jgi:hypothetical protein